jgi:hypothetical protein
MDMGGGRGRWGGDAQNKQRQTRFCVKTCLTKAFSFICE